MLGGNLDFIYNMCFCFVGKTLSEERAFPHTPFPKTFCTAAYMRFVALR